MTMRILGFSLVLCTATALMTWGVGATPFSSSEFAQSAEDLAQNADPHAETSPTDSPDSEQEASEADSQQFPHDVPVQHATDAEDRASLRAIRAQSAAMFAEYNAKHAQAYAARFLPDAEYEMKNGEVLSGREAIEAHFEDLFATYPHGHARAHESNVRTLSLHMAIEDGVISSSHLPDEEEEADTPFLAIWTNVEGRWYLASLRELTVSQQGRYSAHDQLLDLAWLVGDWIDETHDTVVKTSCRWSDHGNFLIQEFTIHFQGTPVVSGTQRIGFDPLTHRLRSWVFDSHGGFGESTWNWDGEKWVIRSTAVRHDGQVDASLNFIIPETDDAYIWESTHRMSDNENLPDQRVRIVRQAPPPEIEHPGQ
ncbi:MAG: SgcJ/EcaC family oxidoreductase [Planctomycetes bacterium]|nr:SgcJ/EcaC family oxidoreductase [Planctomycetota bacterium]